MTHNWDFFVKRGPPNLTTPTLNPKKIKINSSFSPHFHLKQKKKRAHPLGFRVFSPPK
jgi:hypothetical protein